MILRFRGHVAFRLAPETVQFMAIGFNSSGRLVVSNTDSVEFR